MLASVVAFVSSALAASPLQVSERPVALPNLSLIDVSPVDGQPDGWIPAPETGGFSVAAGSGPSGGTAARVSWTPGTKGRLCTASAPVTPGRTVRLTSNVRGEPGLPDVIGLHLVLSGPKGVVDTARRRVDAGTVNWEAVDIRATVPTGAEKAQLCLDVRMQKPTDKGALLFTPFVATELEATSRASRLSLPRIVLVTVETLNRDHLSAYGYPRATSPSLDRLVKEGTSYDAHYATAPYTHPSLASLVTGLLPTTLGFTTNIPYIPTNVRTLAEVLADAGYVTAGFSSQYVLSNRWGMNRGFHYWRNHPNDVPASRLNAELLPWLDAHAQDNTFTWVHYFDPHGPYRPPAGFRERFANDALWSADTMRLDPSGGANEGVPFIPQYVYDKDQRDRRWYVAGYDGDIASWDSELGRLMDQIRARGWERDTLVIVTADHGESMTEHGRFFCHGSLWDHDLHVPMVLWAPGRVDAGKRVSGATSHVDVMPTVLDYAGLLPASRAQASMRAQNPDRLAVSVHGKADALRYAIHDGSGWKIITDARGKLLDVYDLARDAGETVNRVGLPLADAAKALVAKARRARDTGVIGVVNEASAPTLDDEDLERLRALGYVE